MNITEFTQDTNNVWFPDQKEPIYDPVDPEALKAFKEYWKREKERCIDGFSLADGLVKVPGPLYFHTVYWKIAAYTEILVKGKKKKVRKIITPILHDIDWDIFKNL